VGVSQPALQDCKKCILLAEQSEHRVAIADADRGQIVWEWKPSLSNVDPMYWKWFSNPSDVKTVYGGKYILTTASGGGVALIRIADRKTMFYAYAGAIEGQKIGTGRDEDRLAYLRDEHAFSNVLLVEHPTKPRHLGTSVPGDFGDTLIVGGQPTNG